MFKTLVSIFRHKKLRGQMFYTLAILTLFRFGASITIPGVRIEGTFDTNSFLGLVNMLGGGALKSFSLFALGVSPYITSSIVVQLLAHDVVPKWKEHLKSGENGKKALAAITKKLTLLLSILQAFALTRGMMFSGLIARLDTGQYIYVMIVLVAGAMITLFLGDKISEHGIGNGLSIIIFAGIVANLPYQVLQTFQIFVIGDSAQELFTGLLNFTFYMVAWYFLIAFMVFVDQSERKIPVQYSQSYDIKRKEEVSYLPLKVNIAGVIPIIFASSMVLAPASVASFFPEKAWALWINKYFTFNNPWAYGAFLILIFGFTFFQAFNSVNPEELADNLAQNSSFIPGIRPGNETKAYIERIIYRVATYGGLFLVFVAALPQIISNVIKVTTPLSIGGSAMIIVAGVSLETYRQIKGQLFQASYKGFTEDNYNQKEIQEKLEKGHW